MASSIYRLVNSLAIWVIMARVALRHTWVTLPCVQSSRVLTWCWITLIPVGACKSTASWLNYATSPSKWRSCRQEDTSRVSDHPIYELVLHVAWIHGSLLNEVELCSRVFGRRSLNPGDVASMTVFGTLLLRFVEDHNRCMAIRSDGRHRDSAGAEDSVQSHAPSATGREFMGRSSVQQFDATYIRPAVQRQLVNCYGFAMDSRTVATARLELIPSLAPQACLSHRVLQPGSGESRAAGGRLDPVRIIGPDAVCTVSQGADC